MRVKQPTLPDIKKLAEQLGYTCQSDVAWINLDKGRGDPQGTFRNNDRGREAAYAFLQRIATREARGTR